MTDTDPTDLSAPIDHGTIASFETGPLSLEYADLFEGVTFEDLWTMGTDALLGYNTSPGHQFSLV